MKKNLWTILIAFLFGQLIQLVTVSLAHYLYVSDPVMVCIAVAIMTVMLVVLTAVFTLMESNPQSVASHIARERQPIDSPIPPIFSKAKRFPLETEPEDIDEIDKNEAKDAKSAG